jgi:diaminopimelate epimerase
MNIDFIKMVGAGNDFVLIDNRSSSYLLDWQKFAPMICDRRYGVGADGMLIIETSTVADFSMKYYNADGSFGGMCGNGGRCIALFMMNILGKDTVEFEAFDYIYSAKRANMNIKLKMRQPNNLITDVLTNIIAENIHIFFVNTGAPHTVIFMEDLSNSVQAELNSGHFINIARIIRFHDRFKPEGTNVNLVEIRNTNLILMRTYERGIEGETLACGTGAVACAVAASIRKGLRSPINVQTKSNEILTINFKIKGMEIKDVELLGPAAIVFNGNYKY